MENKKELRNWLDAFGLNHPLVIAGPCSAETEDQLLKIAHQLKDTDATVLRAGIWKPRTRPGNFEGVGALGLKWLQKAKEENKPLFIEAYAVWCGPCKMIAPVLDEIAQEYEGKLKICKVDVDANPDIPPKFGIRGIPTLIMFKGGNAEATKVGALSKTQLTEFIDEVV